MALQFRVHNPASVYHLQSGNTLSLTFEYDTDSIGSISIQYVVQGNGILFENGSNQLSHTISISTFTGFVNDNFALIRTDNQNNPVTIKIDASLNNSSDSDSIIANVTASANSPLHRTFSGAIASAENTAAKKKPPGKTKASNKGK